MNLISNNKYECSMPLTFKNGMALCTFVIGQDFHLLAFH